MSFLRKYALWIVLATVACTAGGWAYAARQPVQFTTSSAVDVETNVVPGSGPVQPNLATEEQVATSGVVVAREASALGMTPSALAKLLSVTNKAGTNVLQIACSMPTATAAVSCANAVAAAYANYRNEAGSPLPIQSRDPYHVSVVTSAPLPTAKPGKRKLELLVLSVVVGLALGIGTAFLRDRLDDRVRDRADLERTLQAPVLAEIPALHSRSLRAEAGVLDAPQSRLADAYRHLRARISPLISTTDSQGKVVLVTGPQAGEGHTSVAINLAAVMAYAGVNVLLVDANLRNRALTDEFQVRGQPGLTDLLAGRARVVDVIMETNNRAPGPSFMSAGTVLDRPADLLDAVRLQRAFSQLTVMADVVIVDSGPLQEVSDPLALVPVSDIVIVVADVRRTRRAALTAAVEDLRGTGSAAIVGVLNRVRHPSMRHPAPARGAHSGTRSAAVAAVGQEFRDSGTATSAGIVNQAPHTNGRSPAPAGGDGERETARIDRNPVSGEEPVLLAGNGGEVPIDEDMPTMTFAAVKPSQNRAAGEGPASSNGIASNEVRGAAGPQTF